MRNDILFINLLIENRTVIEKRSLFSIVEKWFAFFNVDIERRSGKSNESTKFIYNGAFLKFLDSAAECSFYSGESKEDTDIEFLNWHFFSNINFENNSLTFAVYKNMISVKDEELISYMISQVSEIPIVYGYAFSENKTIGIGYSMGVVLFDIDSNDDESEELAERVAMWVDALDDGAYFKKLRNVYSYNLFSSNLFRIKIDGLSMGNWIEKSNIGSIKRMNNMNLWKLTKNEIENARGILIKKGKIWEVL